MNPSRRQKNFLPMYFCGQRKAVWQRLFPEDGEKHVDGQQQQDQLHEFRRDGGEQHQYHQYAENLVSGPLFFRHVLPCCPDGRFQQLPFFAEGFAGEGLAGLPELAAVEGFRFGRFQPLDFHANAFPFAFSAGDGFKGQDGFSFGAVQPEFFAAVAFRFNPGGFESVVDGQEHLFRSSAVPAQLHNVPFGDGGFVYVEYEWHV